METIVSESIASSKSSQNLFTAILDVHVKYPLACGSNSCLIGLDDKLLSCLLSLMRDENVALPALPDREWDKLVQTLRSHQILPLVYSKIMSVPSSQQLPDETISLLKQEYFKSKISSIFVEQQLKEILDQFKKEGIRLIVMKGPALARSVYHDPALRPGSDIDILVHPDQVLKARKAMESIGYVCDKKYFDISKKFNNEEVYLHTSRKHYKIVEVHWNLYVSCSVEISQFFDRAIQINYKDISFETLNPVDALLYNALHMIMHHDKDVRLIWIYDTTLLARSLQYPSDWQMLQENSVLYGATRSIQVTLEMARLWTGLVLPPGFDDLTSWPQPEKTEQAALDHIYLSHSDIMFDKIHFMWYCSKNRREKISLLKYLLFPPAEMIYNEFPGSPRWMLPVNFVRRWGRIAYKLIIHKKEARVDKRFE